MSITSKFSRQNIKKQLNSSNKSNELSKMKIEFDENLNLKKMLHPGKITCNL